MSYDLRVWTVERPVLPGDLPPKERWAERGGFWFRESANWQVVVSEPHPVEHEDLPGGAEALVPGLRWLVEVSLEPVSAPKTARALAHRTGRAIAKAGQGIVEDPQADTLETASGVRRVAPVRSTAGERFSVLDMKWLAEPGGPLSSRLGLEGLLDCMEALLPEALPRRYGPFEPPQFRYDEMGREHFIASLMDPDGLAEVWYPRRPVVGVSWGGAPHLFRRQPGHYRADYLSVEVDAAVLSQPGWFVGLQRFWREASLIVEPFFGDVRTLGGRLRRNSFDGRTEEEPTPAGWWKGLPAVMGHAAVVGEPYLDLWPNFSRYADVEGGLAFATTEEWTEGHNLSTLVGEVPTHLTQRVREVSPSAGWTGYIHADYADTFPFPTA